MKISYPMQFMTVFTIIAFPFFHYVLLLNWGFGLLLSIMVIIFESSNPKFIKSICWDGESLFGKICTAFVQPLGVLAVYLLIRKQQTTFEKVIRKLINHYQNVIDLFPHTEFWEKLLCSNTVQMGVCLAANKLYEYWLYNNPIITSYINQGGFWHKCPMACDTKEEAQEALEYRLKILKEILCTL